MDFWWTLLVLNVCGSLPRSAGVTGLQVYYYRQPIPPNTNPTQSWLVEGLATWIGQNAFSDNLDCNTTSNNGAGVGWTGQVAINPFWIQTVANGRRLVLDSFTNSNLGIYTCSDSTTNESVTINITSANPAIQAVSGIVTIVTGSGGQLKVYVSGVPDPTSTSITWFKVGPGGNKTELKEPTMNFSSDHRTLLLSNVQDSDGGTYVCFVTQNAIPSYPSASVSIQLAVTRNNAVFTQQPSNQSPNLSANVTLSCSATGSPAPTIIWIRTDGRALPTSSMAAVISNSTTTSSTLSIVGIQPQDGGQYQCQAIVPGTQAVWSQPANIQVQLQTTPQSATPSTSIIPISTCDPVQGCTPLPLQPSTLPVIIVGTAAGGGAILVLVAVALLLYVYVYIRCLKPHNGVATWPETPKSSTNVQFKVHDVTGNGEIVIPPHIALKQIPSTTADTEVLYGLSSGSTSSPSNLPQRDPIYSPLVAPEEHSTFHEYSGLTGAPVQSDSDYSRLQRNSLKRNNSSSNGTAQVASVEPPSEGKDINIRSDGGNGDVGEGGGDGGGATITVTNSYSLPSSSAVSQPHPQVPQLPKTIERIPMRRHGSNTPAHVPEFPASVYTSTISALSSVPASNLSITSPSNVFGGALLETAPVIGQKCGSPVLSSVPEHAVPVPAYENVKLPAPAENRRYPVPGPTPNCVVATTEAPAVGLLSGDVIVEQPWYEVEETDSDVSVPVRYGVVSTVHQVQTIPPYKPPISRTGIPPNPNAQNSNGTHRVIAYRGSLSRAPPRTEPRHEAFFSSSLSCGTTV